MEYYDFVLPNTRQGAPKSHQDAFSEYGCLEAINLECNDTSGEFDVTVKKEKHLQQVLDDKSHRHFVPKQEILPFGKPNDVDKFIQRPQLRNLYQERRILSKKGKNISRVVADVEDHIHNLLTDHPDAYHGTFIEEFSHMFPYQVSNHLGYGIYGDTKSPKKKKSKLTKSPAVLLNPVFENLNPSLCDIPRNVLNEHILEEIAYQTRIMEYNQAYTGGCIDYEDVYTSGSDRCGVFVYSQGNAMDSLDFQLVNMQPFQETREEGIFPCLTPGSKYRIKINGTVLQTTVTSHLSHPEMCMVGARTQNSVLLASMDKTQVHLSDNETSRPEFISEDCVQLCGGFHSTSEISSISLNPYFAGECVVALYNGSVYSWNSEQTQYVNDQSKSLSGLQQVNISTNQGMENSWVQVANGAHPRQIYLANRQEVNVIDMRTKSPSPSRILYMRDGNDSERVMAILPGSRHHSVDPSGNSHADFQCVVATQFHLLLMDQRYSKVPLLQWSLAMKKPCQHLAGINFHDQSEDFSLLVAANQHPQQIHCIQHKTSDCKPPIAISPVRTLSSSSNVRRSISKLSIPRCQGYVESRLSQPIIGITALNHGNSAAVVHVSECGDLFYQILSHVDSSQDFDTGTTTTGLSNSMYYTERLRGQAKATEKVYRNWAEQVSSQYLKENDPNSIGLCINATKFTPHLLCKGLKQKLRKTKEGSCTICRNACFLRKDELISSQRIHKQEEDDEVHNLETQSGPQDVCETCGNSIRFCDNVVNCHNMGVHPSSENLSSNAINNSDSQVAELNLIDTEGAKDLGMVLVSTWNGSYEELWGTLEKNKLKAQKDDERKAALSVLDLPGDHPAGDEVDSLPSYAHMNLSEAVDGNDSVPDPEYNSSVFSILSSPKTPVVPLTRLECGNLSQSILVNGPTNIFSPVRQFQVQNLNSPSKKLRKSNRKRKSMIGFT